MKKRIIGLLLSVSFIMTACEASVQDTAKIDNAEVNTETETKEEEEKTFEMGGGSPWLYTNAKENITADMPLSEKDDFYLYVNHDWLLNSEIPAGYKGYSSFNEVEQDVKNKAYAVFEDKNLEGHAVEIVQALYSACLDWDKRNEQGMEPIMDTVKKIQEAENLEDVSKLISDSNQNTYLPVFLNYDVQPGFDDASVYTTQLDEYYNFILKDAAEYKSRTSTGELYYKANKEEAAALLMRIGYDKEEAEKLFDTVIELEAQLAEAAHTSAEQAAPDYFDKVNNVMTLSEVSALARNYPIENYLKAKGLADSKQFMVFNPEYIKRLDQIYTEENLDAIKGYMLVKYLLDTDSMLDKEAYELSVKKENTVNGSSGQVSDAEYFFNVATRSFSEVVGQAYLTKYDCSKMKQDITQVCNEVISAYRKILSEEDWLSDETREKALLKLDNIIINAVYPDEWYDYSELSLKGLSYLDCMNTIKKFESQRKVSNVDQKIDRSKWEPGNILEANAYYDPSMNNINILLGILGGDFYREDMTREELLGGIGVVIGHEISHAFDTRGSQFDENGNLSDWWTEEDSAAFKEKTDKLVAYFDGITAFANEKVIGNNVQGEAIADITSIECLLSIAEQQENFNYDVFFKQFAKGFKKITTPQYSYFALSQDVHPLSYLRINVSLQQFDKFFETYDIKPGNNMYIDKDKRILVW